MKRRTDIDGARGPFVSTGHGLSRRHFLRAAGVALSLPMLESMQPVFGRGPAAALPGSDGVPRRMLAVCNNLGLLPDNFFPKASGRDYAPSPYLEILRDLRQTAGGRVG